jgi:N utilization substance protein B
MTRRQIREAIFKLLFSGEFHEDCDVKEQAEILLEEEGVLEKASEEDKEYIFSKYEDIRAHLDEIDETLNEKVDKWKTTRMPKVDLAILRLAVYEIKFEEDIPEGVSINEAVELAKLYGSDKSSSFVNGALSKVIS